VPELGQSFSGRMSGGGKRSGVIERGSCQDGGGYRVAELHSA